MKYSLYTIQKEKGFALLFAVLTSSVLLSVGLSIFGLTLKELVLSSSGRESQFAFYAADTGVECALYWDFKATDPVMFATSTASQTASWRDSIIDANAPDCVSTDLASALKTPINDPAPSPTRATTRFTLTIPNTDINGLSAPFCSIVTVTKDSGSGVLVTVIDSRGYNTCTTDDPNRIERALRVTY